MATETEKIGVKNGGGQSSAPPSTFDWPHPLTDLRQEVERVFDSFLPGWPTAGNFGRLRTTLEPQDSSFEVKPSVDVGETEKAYEIAVELPGLDEKDIELTLRADTLTISGEKKSEKQEKKTDYVLSERRYGSFKRAFRLPDDVKADKITAGMKNGVMVITLPRSTNARAKKRRIEVKAN